MVDFTGVVTDGYYYSGEYMDSETGLYYLRARYMDPATATFTSMDSYAGNIYEPASLHRYLYANANPVKYCDPSGHSPLAMLTTSVSCLSMLRVTKIIGAMALFSGLINAGTKALRTIYNNTFYDTEESIDVRDLLEEFINGFTGGGILGTAMIIVGLIAHTTLLKMYIILTGISVVLGVIQTVIAAYKGDEFGVALSVIFTTLSLIAFGNLYAYNKSVSIKSTEGIEQTVKTDASGENLEVKSEPTVVGDTPKAGDATDLGNGKQYSVMYEAKIGKGRSRSAHRNAANREFYNQMANDLQFKRAIDDYFGYDVMKYMKSGKSGLKNPSPDWIWHHSAYNSNAIQLIPKFQHQTPILQPILHPGRHNKGGYGLYY